MDTISKYMDFLVKHWAPFPRRFPSPFPVNACNLIPEKKKWVFHKFGTCNFSLILSGNGEFRRKGKIWPVKAPCVITQWPGELVEYGPFHPESWMELYIIYPAKTMPRFRQCHFIDPEKPMWPISDLPAVQEQMAELARLTHSSAPENVVDRIDRICERMLLETLQTPRNTTEDERAISDLIADVRRDFRSFVDFEEAASRHGMSLSTFRRRWAAVNEIPPARFLQQLRMREACRRLVETRQPIHEIAHSVGFDDELYFSRRFRKEMQMAPRDYRKAHEMQRIHAATG